jgi:succinate-acetate transporter protein
MWAYRDRDARHVGCVLARVGILNVLLAARALSAPTPWYHDPELGFWFFALACITASGALAALAESIGQFAVLSTLAAGSGIAAGAFIYGSHGWVQAAGWAFVFSAGFAWYVATAMMLAAAGGRVVLPLGKYGRAANVPGRRPTRPIELEWAEPGVKMGQ